MAMKITILWDIRPRRLVEIYRVSEECVLVSKNRKISIRPYFVTTRKTEMYILCVT
jgi:hypothetical protein